MLNVGLVIERTAGCWWDIHIDDGLLFNDRIVGGRFTNLYWVVLFADDEGEISKSIVSHNRVVGQTNLGECCFSDSCLFWSMKCEMT